MSKNIINETKLAEVLVADLKKSVVNEARIIEIWKELYEDSCDINTTEIYKESCSKFSLVYGDSHPMIRVYNLILIMRKEVLELREKVRFENEY